MTVEDKPDHDEVDEATEADVEEPVSSVETARAGRWIGRHWLKIVLVFLVLLVTASGALAASLYYLQYRADHATDPVGAQGALGAAKDGTVAVLSYSTDSLDKDFAAAKAHLTGEFLARYSATAQRIIAPAARQKPLKSTATVVRAAVSELHPNSAVVLLFVNQNTTFAGRPDPSLSASSVLVTLQKVNGAWLISKFDAV
jgi:Mce-associated membrane protein